MKNASITSVICFALIIIIVGTIAFWSAYSPHKEPKHTTSVNKQQKKYEGFKKGNDFHMYNYLHKPIKVTVQNNINNTSNKIQIHIAADRIESKSSRGFQMKDIEKYLQQGSKFIIHTIEKGIPKYFGTYKIDTPKDTTIKMLHIGMITSRWVGANGDYNIGKPGLNAVQGLPFIKMHNMTDVPLSINQGINISPNGILRYTGRDHFGVRLGTIFKDQNNVFPDFIFTVPATDVYYGIVSDIQQPLFGGFQATPKFNDDPDEPHYLLEEGWMGGPAWSNIPYGKIPLEGDKVGPMNRWGQPINNPKKLKEPVGPPVDMN